MLNKITNNIVSILNFVYFCYRFWKKVNHSTEQSTHTPSKQRSAAVKRRRKIAATITTDVPAQCDHTYHIFNLNASDITDNTENNPPNQHTSDSPQQNPSTLHTSDNADDIPLSPNKSSTYSINNMCKEHSYPADEDELKSEQLIACDNCSLVMTELIISNQEKQRYIEQLEKRVT
jgi:hypothetical protein